MKYWLLRQRQKLQTCCVLLLCMVFADSTAFAHPVAQGSLELQVQENTIVLNARVSMEQLLVYSAQSEGAKQSDLATLWREHAAYMLSHLHLMADGLELHAKILDEVPQSGNILPDFVKDNGFILYHFEFSSPQKDWGTADLKTIAISQNILNEFEFSPGNNWEATYLLRISKGKSILNEGLFLTSRQPITYSFSPQETNDTISSDTFSEGRMANEFIQYGILHILTGYDHLLFVAALVLAAVTLWDLVKIITVFTLAHTVTLMLATFNIVRLSTMIVEPIIAASIIFVAIQNIFWTKSSRSNSRLLIAFTFGLFHGLSFAGGLVEAMHGMTLQSVWIALLSFSLGVEIGQQTVILPLFAMLWVIRKMSIRTKKTNSNFLIVQRLGSLAIAAAGIFFLIAAFRSYPN